MNDFEERLVALVWIVFVAGVLVGYGIATMMRGVVG